MLKSGQKIIHLPSVSQRDQYGGIRNSETQELSRSLINFQTWSFLQFLKTLINILDAFKCNDLLENKRNSFRIVDAGTRFKLEISSNLPKKKHQPKRWRVDYNIEEMKNEEQQSLIPKFSARSFQQKFLLNLRKTLFKTRPRPGNLVPSLHLHNVTRFAFVEFRQVLTLSDRFIPSFVFLIFTKSHRNVK